MLPAEKLLEIDRQRVWHPYAPMPPAHPPLVVSEASGVRLRLAPGGRRGVVPPWPDGVGVELIDGMSSWWAALHGYAHPALDAAAKEQLARMSHVMFGGLTHEPAVTLADRLVALAPDGLEHVFLCDSGSVSVEVAVKMCLQYWRSRGLPGKNRLLTWRGGYHGDTFMAMSVCDPEGGMHRMWDGVLPRQVFAGLPPAGFAADVDEAYADELRQLIERHKAELAAVIVEPVVQGAGGMRFHDPGYLRVLREACDAHGVLLVFDEIATGFGRTGALFAAGHAGVSPDVMCVGKALTGGYLSLAAALASGEAGTKASYPDGWRAAVTRIEAGLRAGLAPAARLAGVADVRVLGAIGVVQVDREVDIAVATAAAVRAGVWLRPFRDLVYTMPPYVTADEDVAAICAGVLAAVEAAVGATSA